ncbi:hypothetical protein DFR60_11556 [Hungatella effluvii]|uniref:Uncharacterized protein n=1 Tax=Hungatella effluvii TaxID=1096246 RepID=A0A2V3XXR0_9FIRM|nr:hypothetical protein DFR60_11556 [Hungatella effluvii]
MGRKALVFGSGRIGTAPSMPEREEILSLLRNVRK